MNEILQPLKSHGEQLDAEIAAATGLSLADAHHRLSEFDANGQMVACHSIKFDQGKNIEGIICRLTGFIPSVAPGRKSKAQLKFGQLKRNRWKLFVGVVWKRKNKHLKLLS